MTVSDRIRERRKELGLTQIELANRMGLTARSTICDMEKQGDNFTLDRIRDVAQALECTPAYLMGWEETRNPEFAPDNAVVLAKVAKDLDLMDALKVYLSLPEDKKKYIITLIKSFPTTP